MEHVIACVRQCMLNLLAQQGGLKDATDPLDPSDSRNIFKNPCIPDGAIVNIPFGDLARHLHFWFNRSLNQLTSYMVISPVHRHDPDWVWLSEHELTCTIFLENLVNFHSILSDHALVGPCMTPI